MSPNLCAVGSALPSFSYTAEQVKEASLAWLRDDPAAASLFERFLSSSQAKHRNFCMPIEQVVAQRSISARAAIFEEIGPELGIQASTSALTKARLDPHEVGAVVFTSCSVPAIPSIDALIVQRLGLPPKTVRVPVFQYGCAGGVAGLALSSKLSAIHGPTLLISVELCSLGFQNGDHSGGHLVGAAIFADGATTAVIMPEGNSKLSSPSLEIVTTSSLLVSNTRHLMGYNILDDGWHLRLDRSLPSVLEEVGARALREFCEKSFRCAPEDVEWWLFHPGGLKILSHLEGLVGASNGKAHWAREVLSEIGNTSSSSVLFVTERFMERAPIKEGDRVVMLGIGPGITLELVAFRART